MAPARLKHAVSGGCGVSFHSESWVESGGCSSPRTGDTQLHGCFCELRGAEGLLGYTDWCTQAELMGGETKWRAAV